MMKTSPIFFSVDFMCKTGLMAWLKWTHIWQYLGENLAFFELQAVEYALIKDVEYREE